MDAINDDCDGITTVFPFYEYFPDLEFATWKRGLEKHEKQIKPLPLVLYLEDKWGDRLSEWFRLSDRDREDLVGNISDIIGLVKEKYAGPEGSIKIEDYLAGIEKEVLQKEREYKEQAIRDAVTRLVKEKHWLECFGYLKNLIIDTGDYSDEFIHFLEESKKKVEAGRDWIRRKGKLRRLIENEDLTDPYDLVKQCLNDRDNIKELYDQCNEYGDDNDREELDELANDYYTRIVSLVKNRFQPADALKIIDRIEKNSKDMFPNLPEQWTAYKKQLSDQLKDSIDEDLEKVIEEGDLDNLGETVDLLETTVISQIDIPDIESYVQTHLDSLRKLCENSYILDTIPKSEDVESMKNLLNKVDDVGKDIEIKRTQYGEVVFKSLLFKELESKHKKTRDMITEVLEILGKFNDVLDLLEEESRKILQGSEFRVLLNIRKYQERMRPIERELLRLVKLHDNIKFLFNLKERVNALSRLIFQGSPGSETGTPVDILGEVAEKVNTGDRFYENIRLLGQPENNEPLPLMEQLLDILIENQNKSFIFRNSISTAVVDDLEEIIGKIRRKMDEELSGMEETVTGFHQPPSPGEFKKIDGFHNRFVSIQEEKSDFNNDFDDIKKMLEARRERVDKIESLGRVLQLIYSQQYTEARRQMETAISFEKSLREPLEAIIYFNEHLNKRQWNEDNWLCFFNHHCPHLVTGENQSQYREMFNQYETLLKGEFFNIPPQDLATHGSIFESYLKNSDLFAYIMLVIGKYTSRNFIEDILNKESAKTIYHSFLDYLNRFGMWPIYVDLYRSAYGELKDAFGESPLDAIHETLEDQYHLLEERFCSGSINQQEIHDFSNYIPHDDEFKYYRKKHDVLVDLFGKYQTLQERLTRYKKDDTWKISGIIEELKELESLSSSFSGKFEKIKIGKKWDNKIHLLIKLYHTGSEILKKFNLESGKCSDSLDIDELEQIEDKAGAIYSDRLRAFLASLSTLWKDFNGSNDELSAAGWDWKEKFNKDYFDLLLQKWKQTEFYRLWKDEHLPIPENTDGFFRMFNTVRDNLERFLGYMEKGEVSGRRDSFKILDPFIAGIQRNLSGDEA